MACEPFPRAHRVLSGAPHPGVIPMANVGDMSQAQIEARIDAGDRAQAKLDKQRQDGEELGTKVATVAGAALAGGVYGLLNRRQGGNFYNPWAVGGRIPLDMVTGLGGAAILLFSKGTQEGLVNGAAAGMVALASARFGDGYQAQLQGGPPVAMFAVSAPAPQMQTGAPFRGRHNAMRGPTRQPAYHR